MLLWALNPANPYGYYVLLRVVVCASCAYLAVRAFETSKRDWVWVLGVTALVYNPIVPIRLTRGIWSLVNVATVAILVTTFWGLRRARHGPAERPEA